MNSTSEYFISRYTQLQSSTDLGKIFSRFYNIKGTVQADEGKFKEALEYYDKSIEHDPSNYIAYFNRGTIKADIGDFSGAKADFEAACRLKEVNNSITCP